MEEKTRTCPACGSGELHPGKVGLPGPRINVFVPDVPSWFTYAPGLRMEAMVCMSCGFVLQYLNEEALERVRRKKD